MRSASSSRSPRSPDWRTTHGALMLCDAVQGFGRMAIPEGPDLVAISGHKIHGPKGIGGAVDARRGRAGAAAPRRRAGAGAALGHAVAGPVRRLRRGGAAGAERREADRRPCRASCRSWRWQRSGPAGSSTAASSSAIAATSTSAATGSTAARLISDLRNIAFSLGSACASGSGRPSHVLRAIGLGDREARSSIRLGFGRYTGEEELASACRRIDEAARAQEELPA